MVYKPAQTKSVLKVNASGAGPKFDISEKGDVSVGDFTLTAEGTVPVVKVPSPLLHL